MTQKLLQLINLQMMITDHSHDGYITDAECNKATREAFDTRLKHKNLVTGTEFGHELKKFNQKIISNKTKHLLVENEKHSIQVISLARVILKKIHKII